MNRKQIAMTLLIIVLLAVSFYLSTMPTALLFFIKPSGQSIQPSTSTTVVSSENLVACTAYYYSVLGQEYLYVTSSTTYTSLTSTTLSSVSTFTSTASISETAGYATATTIFKPPSAWELVTCIYASSTGTAAVVTEQVASNATYSANTQ